MYSFSPKNRDTSLSVVFPAIIPPLDPAMSRKPTEGDVGGQSEAEREGGKCGRYLFGSTLDTTNLQL